jgi:FkbM family methyltransferase
MSKGHRVGKKLFECYLRQRWHYGKLGTVHWLLRTLALEEVRSSYGPILCGDPHDFTSALALSGAYGRDISDHIASIAPDATFIDIGASYGLFTLLASQQLRQGHVLAFEPNPAVHRRLLRAVELNGAGNVNGVNAAVGPATGPSSLQVDAAHSGMGRLTWRAPGAGVSVSVIDPASHPLFDSLCTHNGVHIKIDTEGYEYEVIGLLRQAHWFDRVRSIIVEIDDGYLRAYGNTAQSVYEMLQTDGFSPRTGLEARPHYDEIFCRT